MFIAFMTVVILFSAVVTGGSFSRLAQVRLRYSWLIMAALLVQILITELVTDGPRPVLIGLHLATYAVAGIALWANRAVPGLLVVTVGAAMNAVTIALNNGTLPASPHAVEAAGLATKSGAFENSGVLAHPVLPWFGDIMATPSWLPFRNVISIGDIIILVGATIMIHAITRTVPARALAGRLAGTPRGQHTATESVALVRRPRRAAAPAGCGRRTARPPHPRRGRSCGPRPWPRTARDRPPRTSR